MESSGVSSHQHAASLFVRFGGQISVPKEEERYKDSRELAIGGVEWKGNERAGDGNKYSRLTGFLNISRSANY